MTTENTTSTAEKNPTLQSITEKVDTLTHNATDTLHKLAQRVQDEATPYVEKARGLVDRAEIIYQDVRQNINTKIEEQTAQSDSAKEVLSLLKDAQHEAEAALQALRHDFEQLRKAILDLQTSSEIKTYVSQLLAKVFEEKAAEATTVDPVEATATAEETPKPKTTRRKKVTTEVAGDVVPE
jgi:ABC-type transporter Mla subunit MlaD